MCEASFAANPPPPQRLRFSAFDSAVGSAIGLAFGLAVHAEFDVTRRSAQGDSWPPRCGNGGRQRLQRGQSFAFRIRDSMVLLRPGKLRRRRLKLAPELEAQAR